jgi:ribose 5-phosphate isomerase RpiB
MGAALAEEIFQFLREHDIKFEDCRGQSYDNASNMSGAYNGVQALLSNKNESADYIPCQAHSLNLVGKCAVDCCPAVV